MTPFAVINIAVYINVPIFKSLTPTPNFVVHFSIQGAKTVVRINPQHLPQINLFSGLLLVTMTYLIRSSPGKVFSKLGYLIEISLKGDRI
jgi:hypothetical protein